MTLPLPVTPMRFWAALWLLILGTSPYSPVAAGVAGASSVFLAADAAVLVFAALGAAGGFASVFGPAFAGGASVFGAALAAGSAGPSAPSWSSGLAGASWLLGLWVDAIVMYIDLPSSSGTRSGTPWSLTRSENRAMRFRPISGWVNSRPRKRTVTLIRSPSSRNSMARWTLVSKSPTPIFGERRTSLKVTERCLRLASFSRFVSSYLYWPKSRNLTTGGAAIGATSTRSRPRSCAISSALGVGMTPSWAPSSSTTRTCGIRIIWLTRRSRLMVYPLRCACALGDRRGYTTTRASRSGRIAQAVRERQRNGLRAASRQAVVRRSVAYRSSAAWSS